MIPLWTVPLLLAAIFTILGWAGQRWRSRKHTARFRPAWDVPDDVTALDVATLYWRRAYTLERSAEAMRNLSLLMLGIAAPTKEAEASMRLFAEAFGRIGEQA